MRSLFTAPLLAACLIFLALSTSLAQAPNPPLISVTSVAEIKVAPDEVVLRVSAITRDANLEAAKKANDAIVAKALAYLKDQGIKQEDIQTDYISIRPDFRYNDLPNKTKPEYYDVTKSIEIIVKKVERFESILTGVLSSGVNSVEGITFRNSKYRELRIKARAMAVKFSKEKADALAAELEVKRGKVHAIEAIDDGGGLYYAGSRWGQGQSQVGNVAGGGDSGESAESSGFSVGQISITSRVKASFLIE